MPVAVYAMRPYGRADTPTQLEIWSADTPMRDPPDFVFDLGDPVRIQGEDQKIWFVDSFERAKKVQSEAMVFLRDSSVVSRKTNWTAVHPLRVVALPPMLRLAVAASDL